MSRWLSEGGGGLTAYHNNLQVTSAQHNSSKSNSYHGEHFVHADLFNVSLKWSLLE
jgi:hypothetical protein